MSIKQTIDYILEYVKQIHNGKCLGSIYMNAHYKMLWECEKGHQWKTDWNHVHRGTWCSECAGQIKPTIEKLQIFAKNKEGNLISTNYTDRETKLLWECKEKHQWKATWSNILHGTWCPVCFGNNSPTILELQEFAENKEGSLVSIKYINAKNKLMWKCKKGHIWNASWDSIRRDSWCPECSRFKTEYRCKELLEKKLGFELKKINFKCGSHCYQWDGYNKEYKVAFEYHGYQHYVFPNFFQKTEEAHEKSKQRDLDKLKYAKENNIKLIIIPYTEEKTLEEYINNLTLN
jgi:thiol-disulfide isomerase/thioredoxin